MPSADVEIQIPPRPEYVGVLRLALGSLARGAGMDEESIDDLRIAISEACTTAVMTHEAGDTDEPVIVVWRVDESAVSVEISGMGSAEAHSRDVDTQGFSTRVAMSEALLKSLVDGYTQLQDDRVRLTLNLEGRRAEA
jgi:anti-sigma regulatory factor (Ser/Thr protein kinase)